MNFQESQPIFMQIVDYLKEEILQEKLKANEQVPSVRELAVRLGVNPNTAMRAFERLTAAELIYIQRGKGYFVMQTAKAQILAERKKRLMNETLPTLKKEMQLLNIDKTEIMGLL
ncbi:MAG: GntR family transcriptional regulator [Prevotella sp.]|nr:GntR family transcriptional regulator [Prevotella sp.]MCF0209089.1 GntR family transcriptional regulator [Bacteroidaceae bacterium]